MIKIWSKKNSDNIAQINVGTPINSLASGIVNGKTILIAGTFHGGVILVDEEEGRVLDTIEKKHCTYVSSVCFLSQLKNNYACSISADQVIVWQVNGGNLVEHMIVPLDFAQ